MQLNDNQMEVIESLINLKGTIFRLFYTQDLRSLVNAGYISKTGLFTYKLENEGYRAFRMHLLGVSK